MSNFEKMKAARLEKLLDAPLQYKGNVTTYREVVKDVMSKQIDIYTHSNKRTSYEYKERKKAKKEYLLNLQGGTTAIVVPKLLYDYADVPEKQGYQY